MAAEAAAFSFFLLDLELSDSCFLTVEVKVRPKMKAERTFLVSTFQGKLKNRRRLGKLQKLRRDDGCGSAVKCSIIYANK